jgi:hypothetical protein
MKVIQLIPKYDPFPPFRKEPIVIDHYMFMNYERIKEMEMITKQILERSEQRFKNLLSSTDSIT